MKQYLDGDYSTLNNNEGMQQTDMVNSPPHYNRGRFEVIDIIKDVLTLPQNKILELGESALFIGSLWGNVLKYICRWVDKGGVQDLEKTKWYLEKMIKELKEE